MSKIKQLFGVEIIYWLGLFAMLIYLFHNNVLCVDDLFYNFLDKDQITMNRSYGYGSLVMPIENFLMYYLPYKLHINIQDWASSFGGVFQALIIVILAKFYSLLLGFSKISKIMNLVITSILVMFLFSLLKTLNFVDIIIYTGFFRFIFPAVLGIVWLYYLYKITKTQRVHKCFFYLLTVFSVLSSEVVGVVEIICSVFLFSYLWKNKKDNNDFNLLGLSMVLSFAAFMLLVFSNGFQEHLNLKLESHLFDFDTVSKNLYPFLKVYLNKFFVENFLLFAIFVISIIFSIKRAKEEGFDEIFLASSIIFSVLFFGFILVGLGKTHAPDNYWIVHKDIYSIFYIYFIAAYILLFINILKYFEEVPLQKRIIKIAGIILIPIFLMSVFNLKRIIKDTRDFTYLRDKMVLFYLNKGGGIVLPYAAHSNSIFSVISYKFLDFETFLRQYRRDMSKEYDTNWVNNYASLINHYYKFLYNYNADKSEYEITFIDGKTAMDYFIAQGGSYSEIKNHKYHFSDLRLK